MLNRAQTPDVTARYRRPAILSAYAWASTVILTLALVVVKPGIAGAGKVISLATTEWPPYVSQNLANNGFASEIITKAFARVGYTVALSFMPWKRALWKVEAGHYDAAYPAYYSEERARIYALSKPFSAGPLGFYKRKDRDLSYQTLRDLQPYRIGVVRGYVSTSDFDAADFLEKDIADNDAQNLRKLLKGRVDLIVIDKLTAKHLLNTTIPEGGRQLEFLNPPLAENLIHVLFSRRTKDYENIRHGFHRGLQQILEDGTIQQILEKHGLD
jgi:ABC-type amino acid transport substrate-binding protein